MNFKRISTKTKILPFITIPVFVLFSCAGWNWEPVESDAEPALNVYAIVSLDPKIPSFVYVTRTLSLQDTTYIISGYDTMYYSENYYDVYPRYSSNFIISDADVILSDGTRSFHFSTVKIPNGGYIQNDTWKDYLQILPIWFDGDSATVFMDTTGLFVPQPQTHYSLSVFAEGYDTLSGHMMTPPLIEDANSLPDTLHSGTGYTLRWQPFGDGVNGLIQYQSGDWGNNVRRIVDGNDSAFTFVPDIQENIDYASANQSFILTIRAMDAHYYDYFVKGNTDEFFSFVLGASQHALAVGVENGYGLFGAFSQQTFSKVLSSD